MAEEGINVAILKGLIQVETDTTKLATFLDQLTLAKAKQISAKTEGDRLKQSFDKLAGSLDPVVARTLKYNQSVDVLNRSLKAGIITQAQYNHNLALAKERLQDTTTWTQRLGSEIGGNLKSQFLSFFNPATLAIGALTGGLVGGLALIKKIIGDIVTVSIEAEKSQNKVASAVERYGVRAGITVEGVDRLATAQSRLTGADDELIAESIALGLRFNRLSGDEIPRLLRVAQDMAQVTGMELPAAMQKAGSYVNLPLQALTKLRKEGYAVGESQEKLVKDLLRTGDIAGAQAEIFKILEEQYGGAAKEARETLGGALIALGTNWENFLEKVGEDRLGPLRDGVELLNSLVITLTDNVQYLAIGWLEARIKIVEANLAIADSLGAVLKATTLGAVDTKKTPAYKELLKNLAELKKGQSEALFEATAPQQLKDMLALVESITGERKKGKRTTDEQTESEDNLNNKLRAQAEAIAKITTKQQEELKYLQQKLAIASEPPGTDQQLIYEQLQDINEAHEYRLNLLSKIEQFGPKIGKQLADTDRELKKLAKSTDLKFKLQFIQPTGQIEKLRSGIIDLFGGVQQGIDQGMNQLLEYLREKSKEDALWTLAGQSTDPVTRANEQEQADRFREVKEFWEDYAAEVREGWMSNTDVIKREMKKVEFAAEEGYLTVTEKERELARLRGELIDYNLGEWGSFFNTLGGMFGGVFQQISQAIGNIQQAQKAGNQLGSLIGGAGSQLAGTLGYVAGTLAVIYEIYKAVDAQIEKNKRRKWGTSAQVEIVGGEWSSDSFALDRSGAEVNKALRDLIRSILDSLDAVISDLPQISIRARRDGKEFSAYVAGVFVGVFGDAETAIQEGVRYALASGTFDAISAEMARALEASLNATMEELQENINTANVARRARLGDVGFGYAELNDQWLRQIDAIQRLGLAIDDAIAQKNRETQAYIDNVIGMDMASVERLRSLQSLSAGLAEAADVSRAAIRQQMEDIQRQLEQVNQTRGGSGGATGQNEIFNTGGQQNPNGGAYDYSLIDETTERLRTALASLQNELDKIPEALSDVQVDMGIFNILREYLPETAEYARLGVEFARMEVDQKFKELKLTLIAMGEWEQWAAVWNDAYNNAMNLAGQEGKPRAGRGGGRAGGRDEVRDFLSDRREDLRISRLSEHAQAIAELDRVYAPMLEKAGKDKKLREQLLALKDAEIRQLEKENIKSIVSDFQDFTGVANQFDDVRQTATALIDRIEESAMGDPRKAQMISRVLGEMNKQIDRMSKQSAINLFGEMAGDLIAFGETEESLADARQAMALLDHQLKMDQYQDEIEVIRAKGSLNAEQMAILDDAFRRLQGIKIPGVGGNGGGGDSADPYGYLKANTQFRGYTDDLDSSVSSVTESLNNLAESFKSAKDDIRSTLDEISRGELGIISPELAFGSAKEQYDSAIKSAKAGELIGFQEASDVARNYIEALKTFSPSLASTTLPSIQEDLRVLLAAPNVRDENVVFSERFSQFTTAQEKAAALLETGFVAVTNVTQTQTEIQTQMLGQLVQLNNSNTELNARLSRLEAGNQANKRNVA